MRLGFFRAEETAMFSRLRDWDYTGLELIKVKTGRAAGLTIQSHVGQGTSTYWSSRTDVQSVAGIRVRFNDVGLYGSEWISTGTSYFPNGPIICSGSPNGAITAPIGSLAVRIDGGATSTLYVKESGTGTNTGWVAK